MSLTIGSLFSGIGGLELGLEMAGLGPVRWQVEINLDARAVLAAHWPNTERFDDVRSVGTATLSAVDLICGGFPCQDLSSAGKRAGLGGARSGLWTEFRRIVLELGPQWVVVENVASGADGWVDSVTWDLVQLGYAVLPVPLSAADVGAPHKRARVFLVATAHAHGQSKPARAQHAEVACASTAAADAEYELVRVEPGRGGGSNGARQAFAALHGEDAPDAVHARQQGRWPEPYPLGLRPVPQGWRTSVPDVLRVADGISSRLDAARPRIRALGNAVVPQCAEVIGHVIQQLMASDRGLT